MSSRNNLLTRTKKNCTKYLYENLKWIKNNRNKFTMRFDKFSAEKLERHNIQIDYLGIFDISSLKEINNFEEGALIALL